MNAAATATPPRNLWRSTGAILAGLVVVIVLSEGTDWLLRLADVFPPASSPMEGTGLFALALAYRCIYNVIAAVVTARLAPRNVGRHLVVFGAIGFVLGTMGVVANVLYHLGPAWYPIALAISPIPCTWLGWTLYQSPGPGAPSAGR